MDKTLVNHQIVSMRKIVKIARNQIHRKIFKQINFIKKKIDKWEKLANDSIDKNQKQKQLLELKRKLESRMNDAKELKKIKTDTFSTQALAKDEEYFNQILKNSKISTVDRLIARVCLHKKIQASLKKFHEENPGCDQWLPVQIELWEQKRNNASSNKNKGKNKKNKSIIQKSETKKCLTPNFKQNISTDVQNLTDKIRKESSCTPNKDIKKKTPLKSPSKNYTPKFQVTEMVDDDKILPKPKTSFSEEKISKIYSPTYLKETTKDNKTSALIKRIDFSSIKSSGKNSIFDDDNNEDDVGNKQQNQRAVKKNKDKFFLTGNDDEDDDDDDDLVDEEKKETPPKKPQFFNHNNQKRQFSGQQKFRNDHSPFNRNSSYKFNNSNQGKYSQDNSGSKGHSRKRYFDLDDNQQKIQQEQNKSNDKIHPSWKAKMEVKQKQRVSFNNSSNDSKPNKHIKFD